MMFKHESWRITLLAILLLSLSSLTTSIPQTHAYSFTFNVRPCASFSMAQQTSMSCNIIVEAVMGTGTVKLTLPNFPSGMSAMLSPNTGTPAFNAMLTIYSQNANAGSYTIYITGTDNGGGGYTQTVSFTVTVTGTTTTAFDFYLSANPSSLSLGQGASTTSTITATASSGLGTVGFSTVSGFPSGSSGSFSPGSCSASPSCSVTLTITTTSSTPAGTYTLRIGGNDYSISNHNVYISLTVTATTPTYPVTFNPNGGTIYVGGYTITSTTTLALQASTYSISASKSGYVLSSWTTSPSQVYVSGSTLVVSAFSGTGSVTPNWAQAFSFSISNSGGITVQQGNSGSNTITVTLTGGTSQTVSLACGALSYGMTCTFSQSSGYPSFTSTLTVGTTSSTPAGTYTMTVYGNGGVQSTSFTLTVTEVPGDFGISVTQSSVPINAGGTAYQTVQVTITSGSSETVSLSCSGLPSGGACSFNPSSYATPFSSQMTITVPTGTSSGSSTVTVTGSGGGHTHATTFALVVTGFDFNVSVGSNLQLSNPGASGTVPITVTLASGTTQSISLTCSGLPTGATCSFTPSSGNPTFSSTLTITTSTSTPTGTSTVTVTGTGGGKTKTGTFILTISSTPIFDFGSPTLGSSSVTVTAGSSGTNTVTVQSVSGSGTVQLNCLNPPTGVTCQFNPSMGTPSFTSTLTVNVASSVSANLYTITVRATGGGNTHDGTFTLSVAEFPTAPTGTVRIEGCDHTVYDVTSNSEITTCSPIYFEVTITQNSASVTAMQVNWGSVGAPNNVLPLVKGTVPEGSTFTQDLNKWYGKLPLEAGSSYEVQVTCTWSGGTARILSIVGGLSLPVNWQNLPVTLMAWPYSIMIILLVATVIIGLGVLPLALKRH